jgi:hypothetical protein
VEGADEVLGSTEVQARSKGLLQHVAHQCVTGMAAAVDRPPRFPQRRGQVLRWDCISMWVVVGIWYGGQCDFSFNAVRLVSVSFGCCRVMLAMTLS